jgi:hypothetical protein
VKLVGELCEKNKYEENCFYAAIEFGQRPIISYGCYLDQDPPDCTEGCNKFLTYVKNKIGCCFYVIEDAISMEAPGEVK